MEIADCLTCLLRNLYAGQEATIRTGRAHCCLYPELQPTWENTLPLHTSGPHGPNTHNLLHWASPTQGLRALLHPVMPLANGDQGTTPTWCMKQQTGSKSGKEYVKAVYCHLAYLTYMQSISCKMPGWMKYKWESRLPEEMSMTPGHRWHHPFGRKWRETKEPLDENERREWKSWLKTKHSKS